MKRVMAVHGNNGFASRWPAVVERLGHEVRHVNAFSNSVWDDLAGCDALLWNVNHEDQVDVAFARSVLLAAERRGLAVFPNHHTVWHFEDKVAQKFLLEAIDAPLAKSWVFFDRAEAQRFLLNADLPLVFKLRRGAGSINVRMVTSRRQGARLVSTMFGAGLRAFPTGESLRRAASRATRPSTRAGSLWQRADRTLRTLRKKLREAPRERGYVLFQRFMPGNTFDTRVTVIGNRAFAYTRGVRPNDFRASGSGILQFLDPEAVPMDMIDAAFLVSKSLGTQSLACDFVRNPEDQSPVLLEISFTFVASFVEKCPGYFTPEREWVPGHFDPAELVIQDVIASLDGPKP